MKEDLAREVVNEGASSTKDLKRVLGFWDLMGTAVGQIIGAGIMSLTGAAIAMTGRSVPISFILAAVFVLIFSIPQVLIYATARFRGGQYSVISTLVGEKWGGFFVIMHILTNLSIAMYALSFADYALAFLPMFSRKLIALGILTLIYVLNIFGVDKMAKIQNFVVVTLVIALGVFVAFGITQIDSNYLSEGFMSDGFVGLLQAAALLTFATGGATVAANLAGEAKNPTKDVPMVILVSTIAVAVLYGFVSLIAAGVLPISQVANQPLTWVAEEILPNFLYVFFVVGGAMFALVSTLNAQLAWATKPILQACIDGWFPKKLGYIHPKYKTPVILLTGFYLVGLIPILFEINIGAIGGYVVIMSQFINILMTISVLKLPEKMPKLWEKSRFKVSKSLAYFIVAGSIAVCVLQIYLLASDWTLIVTAGNIALLLVSGIYSFMRHNSGKVDVEVSYESV
jgi:APA family basic amino acid/polyamine antiporter